MSFLDVAKKRFSVRKFLPAPVEKSTLLELLEAARIAPSASNKQPWLFYVIEEANLKKKIESCYEKPWITSAPVLLVVCGNHQVSWKRFDYKDHCDIDIAIAIDHFTLEAASKGLGTCWICKFDAQKCAKLLELPNYIEPIALLPVGYPNVTPDITRYDKFRKTLSEIVIWK